VTERPVGLPLNEKGAAMPTQTTRELLLRAARVHQAALVEIATFKRLLAESKALLRCAHRGMRELDQIELKTHATVLRSTRPSVPPAVTAGCD
jgi:hypothetical protein